MKITLKGIVNMTMEQLKSITPEDSDAVREYELFIDNNASCYELRKTFKANYIKKLKKDNFNYSLGVKGMAHLVDRGLELYIKDFYSPGTKIANLLSINDRVYMYNMYLESILTEIAEEAE